MTSTTTIRVSSCCTLASATWLRMWGVCWEIMSWITPVQHPVLREAISQVFIGWTIQVSLNLLKESTGNKTTISSSSSISSMIPGSSIHHHSSYSPDPVLFLFTFLRRWQARKTISTNEAIAAFSAAFLSMWSFYAFYKTLYWMKIANKKFAQLTVDILFCFAESFLINCMVMETQCVAKHTCLQEVLNSNQEGMTSSPIWLCEISRKNEQHTLGRKEGRVWNKSSIKSVVIFIHLCHSLWGWSKQCACDVMSCSRLSNPSFLLEDNEWMALE